MRESLLTMMMSVDDDKTSMNLVVYDLVVIGGGVVGLAVLRAATLAGYRCALIEQEAHLLGWASGSNSGIVCTGVDAAPGTLERALLRDSISQIRPFCREMGLPMRPCGSLVCQWPWDTSPDEEHADPLEAVWRESWDAGDTQVARLSGAQVVQEREVNLNPALQAAVHIPGEIVVDPWLYSIALAVHARQNGAQLYTQFALDTAASSWEGDHWHLVRRCQDLVEPGRPNDGPSSLRGRAVVAACGLWADEVQQAMLQKPTPWKARPRRGQYRIFRARDNTRILHPIQPVPTQRTKGIFVFSTLYDQLVVGPTAEDQTSKTDRRVDPSVQDLLTKHIQRILPGLTQPEQDAIGDYVGVRPGSDHRDYQIHAQVARRWISCAGIRSTGLSASLGIGRHVVYLLQQGILEAPSIPLTPVITRPLPQLPDLVDSFHARGDGQVEIDGHAYRVTHPLTVLGWTARTGLAARSLGQEAQQP